MSGICLVSRPLLLPRRHFSSCTVARSRDFPVLWSPTSAAPDNTLALHVGPLDFGMSVIENLPRFRHLQHIQFEKYTMAQFDDRRITDALSRCPIKTASFTSSTFRNRRHLYSFLCHFPMLEELSCADLHFKAKTRPREAREAVQRIGPSLRKVTIDNGDDLWHAALDGSSFGPIDKLQKVTIMDVKLDDLAKVDQFLRRTKNSLEEFSMRHLHILGHARGTHMRWKALREPFVLSHLRRLCVDIHGKEKNTGLPATEIVLKWWLSMLQDAAKKDEALRLENLTITVGVARSVNYIQRAGGSLWQELDRCLTQNQFSSFKSLRVVIKVFSPLLPQRGESRRQMILDNCPRLQEKGMIDVVVQSVELPQESVE
ncbi:uncharacterized protein EV420DRAFT_1770766 [Desarmillaria tabescens]|uniref:Uncharacterized protein n=1 Tax=Armillaria tabescens TaxID=1929756 RepID=A0AA39J5A0_ARMTA|nr:uncharacterized protein EV420DRAFT_1770766 [Desarmillaria tabescens]KAK0435084.1 hypothetical protein EV420DRAFT_1770766 [Desarmillaria tabescens]